MPLHADYPVFMRLVLDCFDHTVGSDRGDAQAAPKFAGGLVMRSVDLDVESAVASRKSGDGYELCDCACVFDGRGMNGIVCMCGEGFLAVLAPECECAGYVLC